MSGFWAAVPSWGYGERTAEDGRRRVRAGTQPLGVATSTHDVLEFCRRAGLDPDALQLDDELFDW